MYAYGILMWEMYTTQRPFLPNTPSPHFPPPTRHPTQPSLLTSTPHLNRSLLHTKQVNSSVDVYAYGILMWEMYTTQRPFLPLFPLLPPHTCSMPFSTASASSNVGLAPGDPFQHACPHTLTLLPP